mmetsp:Transcript_9092/g.6441  ORF Transcript_9092/g.6441 Transcript_9092/m.6441 type:complete len:150 (+) Transcript_9092:499-948(+)|eukprot:CAMPEP_0116873460 /NCGR_PEP_ID=MMETSP0463-20121206/4582_1 /TAXON_ID=181622 /ORGANISM="Strombidinopsis sp, Strain SopsisLIS2011" /LENGTH=149 /DNA_ID=CAMNT_0004515447 /DNA_START=413 /DNA_END=862 /DNA_ORIENTATION=-
MDENAVDKSLLYSVSDEEKIQQAIQNKDLANQYYKEKRYDEALLTYQKALTNLSKLKKYTSKTDELMKVIFQNFSVVTNITCDYNSTVSNCTRALEIDSKSAKAYYLRSIAFAKMSAWKEALNDAKEAIKCNPNDKNLRSNYEDIKQAK